jgi:serine/threonine protein kinase/Tol biopolymer transport system component
MTPERWRQVTDIFHAARAKEPEDRDEFLRQACSVDPSLRGDVDALLAADDAAGTFGRTGSLESMPHLQPGTSIGPYRVEALVGAGGMGEVYRAIDTRLERTVALKVLSTDLSAALDSEARFQREARLLAALNHPNVSQIYGVEDDAGVRAIAMEFVEGPTLAARIADGPLGLVPALDIAHQLTEALSAAHGQGIVHRDLKPANIKVTPAGLVKVLDFGIAKLTHPDGPRAGDGTVPASDLTRDGAIVGTVSYMSPEQARGLVVDRRTDIWAFGCVLFEMLTGRPAFDGGTASDTLARILEREPPWEALPAGVPAGIRTLLRRCLQKDATLRLHDVADARLEIVDALTPPADPSHASTLNPRERRLWTALAAAAVITVGALWWASGRTDDRTGTAPALVEFGIRLPDNHVPWGGVAVSPAGNRIAAGTFSLKSQLWLHSLDSNESRALAGTEETSQPFWSPDGAVLGFVQSGSLRTIDPDSGLRATICAVAGPPAGATWNRTGVIVFATERGLFEVPAAGGVPARLALSDEGPAGFPGFLPDDRHFIYFAWKPGGGSIRVGSLDSAGSTWLVDSDLPAAFVPPNILLFVRGTALMAQPVDLDRLELVREPVTVAPDVSAGVRFDVQATFSASATVLAFATPRGGRAGQLSWFERTGQSVGAVPQPPGGEYLNPALSPDGRRIAVNLMDPRTGDWDIWLVDVERGVPSRLTFDAAPDADPVWSPDGREIVFASERGERLGLYRQAVDGSTPSEPVLMMEDEVAALVPTDWTRDGRYILYTQSLSGRRAGAGRRTVWALPLAGDRTPIQLLDGAFAPYAARLSPDGNWLAYTSFKTGAAEVYVRRFLMPGQDEQISHGGGVHARWTKDGRELVYWAVPGGLDAVDFTSNGSTFTIGARRPLVQSPVLSLIDGRTHYDVTRDGRRLLARQPVGPPGAAIAVVLNWAEQLTRR